MADKTKTGIIGFGMAGRNMHYQALVEGQGYVKERDHYAYYVDRSLPIPERVVRVAQLARKRGRITIRPFDMRHFKRDVNIVREIWNDAWQDNSDFVPWTEAEFNKMASDLRLLAIPSLAYLAFVEGKPAGISIAIPDVNEILIKMNGRLLPFGIFRLLFGRSRTKKIRLAIMGLRKEYQNRGIDALFVYKTYTRALEMGYEAAEMSLILEDNHKLRNMLESWGMWRYKTFRVYKKELPK